MSGLAARRSSLRCRRRGQRSYLQRQPARRSRRLAASGQLMAQGGSLLVPRLDGVPPLQRLAADERLAVILAKLVVELDIALPGDWKKADCDPTSFIRLTLERWIENHGGSAISRRFVLAAVVSSTPSEWADPDEAKPNQLFLTVEPPEPTCGCAVFGPTLELLEKAHPQLPATFFHIFVGALNCWTRVYDYRDAEDRSETMQEWIAQEPDADQYELPDVASSIPACMRQPMLEKTELTQLREKIEDPLALELVQAALDLDHISTQAKRPELDDDVGQQLSDCNPPLPCLLALFNEADAIAVLFDEEAQGMLEVTPEPNLIIPFDPGHGESVRAAFHVFGVACETLAAASRLVDLMPGNDKWLIER
jgi:hypothetical protein